MKRIISETVDNVCKYFKYGFCKFRDTCNLRHNDEICEEESCDIKQCFKRHPRQCRYYREYNRCKFGVQCCYRHDEYIGRQNACTKCGSIDVTVQKMQAEVEKLTSLVQQKSQEIAALDQKIKEHEISKGYFESIKETQVNLSSRIQELGDNYFILLHSVDDLEKAMKTFQAIYNRQSSSFCCSFCGKAFPSNTVLRYHLLTDHRG